MDHGYAKMATASQREGGREPAPPTRSKSPTEEKPKREDCGVRVLDLAETRADDKLAAVAEASKQRAAMIVSFAKPTHFESEDAERERQTKEPREPKNRVCKEDDGLKGAIWRKSRTATVLAEMFPPKDVQERNRLLQIIDAARKAGKLPYIRGQRAGDVQQLIGHQEGCPPQPQGRLFVLKQEDPLPPRVKEEEKGLWISQEGETRVLGPEEAELTKLPMTVVSVKTEDQEDNPLESPPLYHSPSEEKRGAEPPISSSPQRMEADGDHCGGSQADNLLALLSDSDDTTSRSPEDEDGVETQEPKSSDADLEADPRTHTDGTHFESSKKKTVFTCTVCAKVFSRKYRFTQHMWTHTAEKPFSCSVCGKKFARKAAVVSHMRRHTGEKPFSCSICSEKFSHSNSLTYHMQKHTGEKRFACFVCGQGFCRNTALVIHLRTHTGEKPFACSVCNQRFSRNTSMVVHMRTHTGEKPFSCSVCGRSFCLNSALVSHMRIHTGEYHVACSICGQKFSRKANMVAHLRRHTGEKPFSCSVCGKSYSHKISLTVHTRTHDSK